MSETESTEASAGAAAADTPIPITRRRIDLLLVGLGAAVVVVLLVAGGLLTWGSTFASDYVHDELAAQNITFPPAESLEEDGREDLVQYADEQVDSGSEAEAYASLIGTHVEGIADGATYSELGGVEREAQAAVEEAVADGASDEEVAALEEEAAGISAQRDSVFKGEILRGTLLSTYAWSTIAQIADIAAFVAFAAAIVMLVLVVLGVVHLRRMEAHS